jgi:hypothetical protein
MALYTLSPSTQEAEASLVYVVVSGQPGLHRETMSCKNKTKQKWNQGTMVHPGATATQCRKLDKPPSWPPELRAYLLKMYHPLRFTLHTVVHSTMGSILASLWGPSYSHCTAGRMLGALSWPCSEHHAQELLLKRAAQRGDQRISHRSQFYYVSPWKQIPIPASDFTNRALGPLLL